MFGIGLFEILVLIGLVVLILLAGIAIAFFRRSLMQDKAAELQSGSAQNSAEPVDADSAPTAEQNSTSASSAAEGPTAAAGGEDASVDAESMHSGGDRPADLQDPVGAVDDQSGESLRAPSGSHADAGVPGLAEMTLRSSQEAAEIRAEADGYQRDARSRADLMLREAQAARHDADDEVRAQRAEVRELRNDLERREQRLAEREERLDVETRALAEKGTQLDTLKADMKVQRKSLAEAEIEHQHGLERIAALTAEQAKAELVASVEHDAKRRAVIIERDIERQAVRDGETRARSIIVGTIQRVASDQTSESVVSAVHLPGDDMKGRIIGREGRNIRCFEQVTGVNVMIDDTPESVLLSCFDPVRRETARITLEELVRDGRIHPARIEEVHERSKNQIEEQCLRAAEDAMTEVGISDLHPDLIPILGALRYRTSYGQNVLKHLIECAHIAGIMAAELGLDVAQCKRSAFLHDIGKALTHEVEGSHALIGADLARRFGEHPDVVHAIEAHHNEVEVETVEAVLTQAADAISGGRPGARRESIEAYVQRLERLEEIAAARDGVEKVFAMQAGREVRVMVAPDVVDDIEAQVLARDIAKQVEEELTYPGQIRVTVVRESRATETAR